MTDREQLLEELRSVAFAIAYRMLGSVSEAEDVVQEALLRVHQALDTGEQIASPRAFVATVTTRLAIITTQALRQRLEEPGNRDPAAMAGPVLISGMRVEPPSEAARTAQLASSSPALREAYISVNLCLLLPSSVPCVSYGAPGCKPFLGTHGWHLWCYPCPVRYSQVAR